MEGSERTEEHYEMPTNVMNSIPKQTEEHYEMPTNVMNSIPKQHVITECGDFNAHLGEEKYVKYTFHERDHHITYTLFKKKTRETVNIHLRYEMEKVEN